VHTSITLEPEFRRADKEVSRRKAVYMRFALWAAWLGASAVFFAILQLSELFSAPLATQVLPWLEFSLATAAVGVALVGLGGRKQQNWFLARYRAERLRLLKYEFLTRFALWSNDSHAADDCCQGLAAEVEETKVFSFSALEYWVTRGTLPHVVTAPQLPEKELVVRRIGGGAGVLVGKTALVVAATLPVCGAGIRVFRGVLEYSRNASRYEATHNVLVKLSERLREANDSFAVFREIGFCEQILEADLREWLRLMVEAEWFG
jgi:hypothetical protein